MWQHGHCMTIDAALTLHVKGKCIRKYRTSGSQYPDRTHQAIWQSWTSGIQRTSRGAEA